jgi:putative membrane protein
MDVLGTVFVALAAVLHLYIWWMESVAWRRPVVWRRFGLASQTDADTTAPLAYNQGFYNLFLAIGAALGVVLYWTASEAAGFALAVFATGSMVAAAAVLLSTGRERLRAAATQGILPLLGVLFFLLALPLG